MIRWEADFPADVRAIVEPVLTKWAPLIPTWCQDFAVRYSPDKSDLMAVQVSYENRWARLHVTGHWLADPGHEREVTLLHELLHVATWPAKAAMDRIIGTLEEGTALRSLAESTVEDGMEASVEDLARGVKRLVSTRDGSTLAKVSRHPLRPGHRDDPPPAYTYDPATGQRVPE